MAKLIGTKTNIKHNDMIRLNMFDVDNDGEISQQVEFNENKVKDGNEILGKFSILKSITEKKGY